MYIPQHSVAAWLVTKYELDLPEEWDLLQPESEKQCKEELQGQNAEKGSI